MKACHVPQECEPDPGEGVSRPLVHHLHRAPGCSDQGVRAAVPGADQLLDPLLCALPVDHRPAPGDTQCLLHSHPVNSLQGEQDHPVPIQIYKLIFLLQLSPILNATVIWWNLPRFVSNYCIHPIRSVFRVTAGYFYLKRGRTGQIPSELFDYK